MLSLDERVRVKIFLLLLGVAWPSLAAIGDLAGAARNGNWSQVRTLAAVQANVRFIQPDGMTALHWAVQANQEDAVALLLKSGADANAANRYGITPLWLAATNGSAPAVRMLLKAGARVADALPHGETALMAAARTGDPETVRLLLAAGANPNGSESSQGETALMWAAAENQGDVIALLVKGGADPDRHAKPLNLAPMDWMQVGMVSTVLPRGGFTALMYAARQDAKEAARALADSGANLDLQDPDGTTALEFAIINQHYDLAALLLEKGANPNVADNTGMNAVYAAVDMVGFRSEIGRPFHPLPDKLTALDVVRLALGRGGNPNARLTKPALARHHGFPDASLGAGATPLMRAAKTNDVEAMQALLDGGADPRLSAANGQNALAVIAGSRQGPRSTDALRLLVRHGANPNTPGARGDLPLHAAARLGSNDVVRTLVELGADIKAKDSAGKTALDLVKESGRNRHEDTEKLLNELSANQAR